MKWIFCIAILKLWIIATAVKLCHVIPVYSYTTYCLQPCTTLDDLLLNNSLSNISNVEFKLLPGVYNVTSNIVIQHVHNVSFVGITNSKAPEVILKCSSGVFFVVIDSFNVTISNFILKQCHGREHSVISRSKIPDLDLLIMALRIESSILVAYCSFISVQNVTIFNHTGYGIIGLSVIGKSFLNCITISVVNEDSQGIILLYFTNTFNNKEQNIIIISKLLVRRIKLQCDPTILMTFFLDTVVLKIIMRQEQHNMSVVFGDSTFTQHVTIDPIILLDIKTDQSFNDVLIRNCNFINNKQDGMTKTYQKSIIDVSIHCVHVYITFLNCTFNDNVYTKPLITAVEETYLPKKQHDITSKV